MLTQDVEPDGLLVMSAPVLFEVAWGRVFSQWTEGNGNDFEPPAGLDGLPIAEFESAFLESRDLASNAYRPMGATLRVAGSPWCASSPGGMVSEEEEWR